MMCAGTGLAMHPVLPAMSVILAIESNQQQIAQLTAIVRGLGAELVSAKTAENSELSP